MAKRQLRRFGLRRDGPPDLSPLAAEQRHRCRTNRTRLSAPRSPFRIPHLTEPPPRHLPRQAQGVEPQRIVVLDPRGQHLGLPGPGRDLEAVEEIEHRREPFGPLGTRALGHPLPPQQEAQEVRRSDGLDLLAQPIERVAVDARQQAALAPLQLLAPRREAAAQHEPLMLQRPEGEIDVCRLHSEGAHQFGDRRWPDHLEPPTHQLADRVFAAPRLHALPLGDGHLGLECGAGVDRRKHRHALGRDPQRHRPTHHRRSTLTDERLELPLPFRIPHSAFRTRQGAGHQ